MPHLVFISYASEDKSVAERVCGSLEKVGIGCWIAPRDIEAGVSFPAAIVAAIEGAQALVLVLSAHSNASPHVRSEVERAFSGGVPIIPLRIDSAELSADLRYFLGTAQRLDARDGAIDAHLEQLRTAVADAEKRVRKPGLRGWRGWTIAALLLISAGAGIYYFTARRPVPEVKPAIVPPVAEKQKEGPKTWLNPTNGQVYVWIPPGKFLMGCSAADSECKDDEKPAHWVSIKKGFWLGQTEVTRKEFRAYASKAKLPVPAGGDELPVTDVDWAQAKAYCAATGGRLPTEAEWEYAARGGQAEARYGALKDIAWYSGNSGDQPHEVGKKEPNAFGLYDMLGNVSEWVLDRYYNKYYEEEGDGAPEQPLAGNASGVLRGGSWGHDAKAARVSNRFGVPPDLAEGFAGFRCAKD